MAKAFQKNATLLFACSELAGHYAFAKSPFKVYRNAIDVSKYRFDPDIREIVRSELSLHGKFVVGHVGRFNSVKNHIFLLEVFHHVIKKNPNSILVLIGTGPLTKKIAERINVMKMTSQVLMLGARSDVERLYQGMDVFVLPSLFEGFPVVAVEAQAAGLMTICATNITNEVQLTDLCHEFPLSKATEAWAEYILLNAGSYVRQEKVKEIARAGYDSKQATLDLQKKYLELHALNP
ncbi:MAG: glycosyltransferase [Clostridia bacterium]|nr:glycosyltransferase [Clostridia bacterium]